jgi:predicted transcriptional regulator
METPKYDQWQQGLSKLEIDVIEGFESDYNAVDQWLRKQLSIDNGVPFTHVVKKYSEKHAGWRDAEVLRTIAEVRNAIVHGKMKPYEYVAIPTPFIAEQLKRCCGRLINRDHAIPAFQREVQTVSLDDKLSRVLKVIDERNYSQFPVYEDARFCGLLTENGVTRWLAHHVAKTLSLVELDDIPIKAVIKNDEKRKNYRFVRRDMLVDDIKALFGRETLLEAVLITTNGKPTESLLGIATRWDIISLL